MTNGVCYIILSSKTNKYQQKYRLNNNKQTFSSSWESDAAILHRKYSLDMHVAISVKLLCIRKQFREMTWNVVFFVPMKHPKSANPLLLSMFRWLRIYDKFIHFAAKSIQILLL